ncbi:MAG: flagellar basal body P-ring formation chaperone FlgA [Syntrophorhabdus sp.]
MVSCPQYSLHGRQTGLRLRSLTPALFFLVTIFILAMTGVAHAAFAPKESIIEARIIKFIKEIYPGDSVRIRLNAIPEQLKGKIKVINLSFARVPDTQGDGICSVEIESAPGRSRSVQVPFKVFPKKEIFVLKQAAKKGDIVGANDIITRETYTNGKTQGYPVSAADIVGRSLKRDAPGNTVITSQILEERIAVKQGDTITIIAESNKLIVQAKGRTIDKGRIGDTIRVKNLASGKELTAKVVSSTAVKVEF